MVIDPVFAQVEVHMNELRQEAERRRLTLLAKCCSAIAVLACALRSRRRNGRSC